jgi:hypothetical protein
VAVVDQLERKSTATSVRVVPEREKGRCEGEASVDVGACFLILFIFATSIGQACRLLVPSS